MIDQITLGDSPYVMFKHKVIGKGTFSTVYLGLNTQTHTFVAVKEESVNSEHKLLEAEYNILKSAHTNANTNAHLSANNDFSVLEAYWYGTCGKNNYLVVTLLGNCLNDLHRKCGKRFSPKTILMLIEQILTQFKYYHKEGIIHRDIKPDNFMFEFKKEKQSLVLVDFGLATRYIDSIGSHIEYKTRAPRVGTLKYISPHVHQYKEASRRDDMYSICYLILYLLNGNLPWQGVSGSRQCKHEKIFELKSTYEPSQYADLVECECVEYRDHGCCSFTKLIADMFRYTGKLRFVDPIDYNRFMKQALLCMKSHGYQYDYKWDWI